MAEIEQQYAFVGGTVAEYAKYVLRADLPHDMWTWGAASSVKAVGGFAAVLTKGRGAPAKALDGVLPKFRLPSGQHSRGARTKRRRGTYPLHVRRSFLGRSDA